MRPLIVIGSGGHARVLIEVLQLCGAQVLGAVDSDRSRIGQELMGVRILGTDEVVLGHDPTQVQLVCGIGSTAPGSPRQEVYLRYRGRGYDFASVVHPKAVLARDVQLGDDSQVMAGVVIQPGVRLGHNVILNTGCCVDHDCVVGDHAHVSPGATLCGGVEVGEGAHIGAGATIVQGVTIGAGAFVYAGAVVTQSVGAGARVAGVPARAVSA